VISRFAVNLLAACGLRPALALLACFAAAPASAEVYTYIKLGIMDVDVSARDNPVNLAIDIGYDLDSDFANMSIEAEINRSVDHGKTRDGDHLEFESNGLYLVYRTTRSLFATLRLGIVENNIVKGSSSNRDNGMAIGGSVGMVIGRTRLQIEYTSIAGDANFFSVGLAF